ncbi:MAG: glutamine--tRNA ligase/YqeY domain fusion protein [Reyranella sp.]|nr:glutamine--tRNA ligase/YqeY domain fusion protein [Reyranella sp.]
MLEAAANEEARDFIRDLVQADLARGQVQGIVTRFPPEPNGYLHLGHAKSICLNFGLATEFGGRCHLRFDDTNPVKEEQEYIDAIKRDVRWLGFDWGEHLYHASDYFQTLYDWAEHLIRAGLAYVDDTPPDEMRAMRGTLTEPGRASPDRDRSAETNFGLFRDMRAGKFANGACVLRAKIDLASGNMNLRDPVLYRILHVAHPRTGTQWCIYPTYDFAHGQSDALEHVTHSLCTLEFADHRPLYDWFLDHLPVPSRPRQTEFARLNIGYTVLSKRYLTELVRRGIVSGWDDPRMPTLAGLRRRGVPPEAIRDFVQRIGMSKANSVVDLAMFDHAIRDRLNQVAQRRMAVLRPLKLVIENFPENHVEELEAVNHPGNPGAGTRRLRFGREIFVERDDFMENPSNKFFRLAVGREVRLRYAYLVTCREVVKDAAGNVVELRCTYDPASRGGNAPDGRKVKATLHWVSARVALPAEVRLYSTLFNRPDPGAGGDLDADLNPGSLEVLSGALLEPSLAEMAAGEAVQFERLGYFCADLASDSDTLVFNRTIELRDTWAKVQVQS